MWNVISKIVGTMLNIFDVYWLFHWFFAGQTICPFCQNGVRVTIEKMIKIYYSPSCSSCRKVRKWFDEQKIPHEDKDIFSGSLSVADLKEIISKSIDGTDEIISPRSKIVSENDIDFDSMTISELIAFIREHPSVLRRPIIVSDRQVQVGYNEEEIRTFIPRARRLAETSCDASCEKYATCPTALDRLK